MVAYSERLQGMVWTLQRQAYSNAAPSIYRGVVTASEPSLRASSNFLSGCASYVPYRAVLSTRPLDMLSPDSVLALNAASCRTIAERSFKRRC